MLARNKLNMRFDHQAGYYKHKSTLYHEYQLMITVCLNRYAFTADNDSCRQAPSGESKTWMKFACILIPKSGYQVPNQERVRKSEKEQKQMWERKGEMLKSVFFVSDRNRMASRANEPTHRSVLINIVSA